MTSIERRLEVDAPPADVWPLLGDPDGWARWLADEAEVEIHPGGRGRLVEDGTVRQVEVDDVEAGRRVTFHWWPEGDEADRSRVELELVPDAGSAGPSTVVITETRVPAGTRTVVGARIASSHLAPTAELRLWLACSTRAQVPGPV
jgi:uncharacterized protein YndB with AHSA1/START domain